MLLHFAYKAHLTAIDVSWCSPVVFVGFMCLTHMHPCELVENHTRCERSTCPGQ